MMNIGVLTSSRADYGIYKPLLRVLKEDPDFNLHIIAFGTHLSRVHGYTLNNILEDGFEVDYSVNSLLLTDDENSIATAVGLTTIKFADFWMDNARNFDYVLCLGDRYEMFGAVTAGIPFGVNFAHFHGGETTLGAIDNVYRHSISLASSLHFTATEKFKKRLVALLESDSDIHTVGALALDNLDTLDFLSIEEFKSLWNIDLSRSTILVTLHPETVNVNDNAFFIKEFVSVLETLSENHQIVITMPNADTQGNLFREAFKQLKDKLKDSLYLIENFGTQSYFTCMKHSVALLGNTSSGIIEAASFKKYVINVGDRQKGRLSGDNVINVPFDRNKILDAFGYLIKSPVYEGENLYYSGGASEKVINVLKNKHGIA